MTHAPINRIKNYCNPVQPVVCHGAVGYDTVVQFALATMHRLMSSFDSDVAFEAANAVLELEKARLRHKVPVAGDQRAQQPVELEVDERAAEPSMEQAEQFEKAVDEFVVMLNRKQTDDGLPEFSREVLRMQYEKKRIELGFGTFLEWHDWMMGRKDTPPVFNSVGRSTGAER
jgi:hypothetical protein